MTKARNFILVFKINSFWLLSFETLDMYSSIIGASCNTGALSDINARYLFLMGLECFLDQATEPIYKINLAL
jgi:hypothetical protein